MTKLDSATLVSLVGAVGVGGLLNQVVSGAPGRRQGRADVRRQMTDVERLRWNPGEDVQRAWEDSLRNMHAACLGARMPRRLVSLYLYAAQASRAIVIDEAVHTPEPGINSVVHDYILATRNLMEDYLWAPWLTRLQLSRKINHLNNRRELIKQSEMPSGQERFLGHEYKPV